MAKDNETSTFEKIIESTLIDFPISIKYKSERYNNFRTYLLAGINIVWILPHKTKLMMKEKKLSSLKDDLLGEVGSVLFFLEYFKFSPEIKLSYGFLNIISKDDSGYKIN